MAIHLLPEPKELMLVKGTCVLDEETIITLPAQSGEGAWFAARQLRGEIENAIGLPLSIVKAHAPPHPDRAILLVCGPDQAVAFEVESCREQLRAAEDRMDTDIGDVRDVGDVHDQAYALGVQRGRIVLYADALPGLYYAVQSLRQLVRLHRSHIPAL